LTRSARRSPIPPKMERLIRTGALWAILPLHERGGNVSLTRFAILAEMPIPAAKKAALALRAAGLATLTLSPRRGSARACRLRLTGRGKRLGATLLKIEAQIAREQARIAAERVESR
jgi:hypothetical protein